MVRLVVTAPAAAAGFRDARRWLLQDGSGPDARRRWNALLSVPARLRTAPCSCPMSDEHPGCRKLSVSGYRVIYRIEPDTGDNGTAGSVLILAVFGPGQADG